MKIAITIVMAIMLVLAIFVRCIEILILTVKFMCSEGYKTLKAEYYKYVDALRFTWKEDEKKDAI